MLQKILDFFSNLTPDIIVRAPARINLINPLDAVEADYWMPSVAINGTHNPLSAFCYLKILDNQKKRLIKIYKMTNSQDIRITHQEEIPRNLDVIKSKFTSILRLFYASVYRFWMSNSMFKNQFFDLNFEIGLLTTIPPQSGLGGSSAIIIALLYIFAKYFNLINTPTSVEGEFSINKDTIAEMATKVEDEDLGITAGYADRYVISRGGLCFTSYVGKLKHHKIGSEPLAIYDRIDQTYQIKSLPIIVCYPGVAHNSGQVHKKLRYVYIRGNPQLISYYKQIAVLSWKSRFALMNKDWRKLGILFEENSQIMNKVMVFAGFNSGIGTSNTIMQSLLKDLPYVYGSKLTGAGGGGSIFALVDPLKIDDAITDWNKRLIELINEDLDILNRKITLYSKENYEEIKNTQFFKITIDKFGVRQIL